jgi:hypothetical protein
MRLGTEELVKVASVSGKGVTTSTPHAPTPGNGC